MSRQISLAHGDGGAKAHELIQSVFVAHFGSQQEAMFDSAMVRVPVQKLAITTDSFIIKPIFFPGGNIGKLAVAGTVNDLSVSGAVPLYLTAGFIIEEGFPVKDLETIVRSMAEEAKKAGVKIVAGDTKVGERGSVDGIFINTTGIGFYDAYEPKPDQISEGDAIIINGTIGDHGMSVLLARGELGIHSDLQSDCATLEPLIKELRQQFPEIRIMRDPTRGGVATSIVELCEDFRFEAVLYESELPIRREVEGACDILGFDPLYLANEGKVILIAPKSIEKDVVEFLRSRELGKEAKVIGHVTKTNAEHGKLFMETPLKVKRRLNRLENIQLPRIC